MVRYDGIWWICTWTRRKNRKRVAEDPAQDTFDLERVNMQNVTSMYTKDEDPFIEAMNNPAHVHHTNGFDPDRLEEELWSMGLDQAWQ